MNFVLSRRAIATTTAAILVIAVIVVGVVGYFVGDQLAYQRGYDEGYDIGYPEGYDIGWDDGYENKTAEIPPPVATIWFYTSIPTSIAEAIIDEFEAAYPTIDVELMRGGTGPVMSLLEAEWAAGSVRADVISVAESAAFMKMKDDGWLLQYQSPELASIPDEFEDPDGYFAAARIICPVITWNTESITDPPNELADLPAIADEVVIPDPLYSGAMAAFVAATIYELGDVDGWNFWQTMHDNGVLKVSSNGKARDSVVAGERPIGITLDYMMYEKKAAGEPVDLLYPADGTAAIPSPIGIMSTTEEEAASKIFVDFFLSKEGQQFFADEWTLPVRADVTLPEGRSAYGTFETMTLDWVWIYAHMSEIMTEWTTIFG